MPEPQQPLTFDAELAPGLLGELFADLELEPWDPPLLVLPSPEEVRGYLLGKGSDRAAAQAASEVTDVLLSVTKRGVLAFALKR